MNEQPKVYWGLTGTLLWTAVLIVTFFAAQLAVMIGYIISFYPDADEAEVERLMNSFDTNDLVLSLAAIGSALVASLLMVGVIKLKRGTILADYLAVRTTDIGTVLKWLVVIIVLIIASDTLTWFLGRPIVPEVVTAVYESMRYPLLLGFTVVIVAPVFEELFFRGFMIAGMENSVIGPVGAVVVSSIVWSAIHLQYDLYETATIFVIGLILGAARLKSGSILLVIGLHAFVNLVSTIEVILIS